jgi:hypothetical protein
MRKSAFLLVGLSAVFLLAGVVSMLWNYRELRYWQPVIARVIAIDVAKFTKNGSDRYRGEITIRYSVDDIFRRVPYSLPTSYATEESARSELSRFPPGTPLRVFYNPANPDDMVQDVSASPRFFILPGILATIGLILGAYCLHSLRKLGNCLCPGCAASVELWDKFCYVCDYRLPKQRRLIRL